MLYRLNFTKTGLILLCILAFSIFVGAKGFGVALFQNTKTKKQPSDKQQTMINNAADFFYDNMIPYVTIDEDEINKGALDFFEVFVVLSDASFEKSTIEMLKDFMAGGGIIAATHQTNLHPLLNLQSEGGSPSVLNYTDAKTTVQTVNPYPVKPFGNAKTRYFDQSEYAATVITPNSIYFAAELFNGSSLDRYWEKIFTDAIYSVLENTFIFSLDLGDLNNFFNTLNRHFLDAQKLYLMYVRKNQLTPGIDSLYEDALHSHRATQFFLKKEVAPQGSFYLGKLKSQTAVLFEAVHPLQQSPEELLKRSEFYYDRTIQFGLEKPKENAIIFVGDSLTQAFALDSYFQDIPTINRGISADFASGVAKRLELLSLDQNPRAICLMIGTNNLTTDIERDTYFSDIEKIIDHFKEHAPLAKLYLQSVLPLGESFFPDAALLVKPHNNELKVLASRLNVEYLDIYSLLEVDGYLPPHLSGDGVHLWPEGYRIWAEFLREKFLDDGII